MDVSSAAIFLLVWLTLAVVVSLLWGLVARTMERDRGTDRRERSGRGACAGPDRRQHPRTGAA